MLSFWYIWLWLCLSHWIHIWLSRKERLLFSLPAPLFQICKPPTQSRIRQSSPGASRRSGVNLWIRITWKCRSWRYSRWQLCLIWSWKWQHWGLAGGLPIAVNCNNHYSIHSHCDTSCGSRYKYQCGKPDARWICLGRLEWYWRLSTGWVRQPIKRF